MADKPVDSAGPVTPKGDRASSDSSRETWGCFECSKTMCYVHLTNFLLFMFVLADLQVVADVTTNRTFSLLECYLIAFAGVVAGYFKAAPFNAFIQGSMARIAALPHVYHWDFISSELFVVMPFVLLLVGVTRYFALSHPSLNDLLLMFDVAVCTMMLMTLPQLWYHWTQEERGARLRMFDWQLELPLFGIYTKKLFETYVDIKERQLMGTAAPGLFWCLPHSRPWGSDEECEPLLTIRRCDTTGEAPNPELPSTTMPGTGAAPAPIMPAASSQEALDALDKALEDLDKEV